MFLCVGGATHTSPYRSFAFKAPCYFDMDNELQALLTLLSIQLNSAFHHHDATAFMCRRKAIVQHTVTVLVFSSAISPTLIGKTLLMELWFQRNGEQTFFFRSRWALIGLIEKLRQHAVGTKTMWHSWMFSQR